MSRFVEVQVDGLINVRDLGGLRREDGSLTPSGVFFRSENVDAVTPAGWEQLRELGVRTVVDLRQERERARDRNPRPDWLTTRAVDLDGWHAQWFWKDYWENGLVGTALYYTPHLIRLPRQAGMALSAIVSAPPGGVLFHCMGGRDRTGMIAMLLLSAIRVDIEEVVADYMQTVLRGPVRAARAGRPDNEPELEAFCRERGTSTERAFRDALTDLDFDALLTAGGVSETDRRNLWSWRGAIPADHGTK